jgi:hypothetical protein
MVARLRSPTPYIHGIVLMSVCVNFGPYRSSRLAAYTGHVMLSARLRAHVCTLPLADPNLHGIILKSVCWSFGHDGPAVWLPVLDM